VRVCFLSAGQSQDFTPFYWFLQGGYGLISLIGHEIPNRAPNGFARKSERAAGQPVVFALAAAIILLWQLVVNTGTTIITFLMVFLIQNTQNRDAEAMHIKMDELIRAIEGAHNALLNLEDLDEEELDEIRADYIRLAKEARAALLQKGAGISREDSPGG